MIIGYYYLLVSLLFVSVYSLGGMFRTIKNDGLGGKGIILLPKSEVYSKVVFWFHGLGDTADGWASLMPMLAVPDTKFILPTAPRRSITLNGGMGMNGWSDIIGLDADSPEDRVGFDESAARVKALIDQELAKGISSNKILIGGFSQGGALALHISLRWSTPLAGCVALSTWLPFRADYPMALSGASKSLPIFQAHGEDDVVVSHHWGIMSHRLLKDMVTDSTPIFKSIEGMGHSSDPEEIEAVKHFIAEKLA